MANDKKHFAYLAQDPGFDTVFKKIFDHASSIDQEEGKWIVHFENGARLVADTPAENPSDYAKWPKSFQELVSKHEFLNFYPDEDASDPTEVLGDHGAWDHHLLKGTELEANPGVLSPILTDVSDIYVYHPGEKTKFGESTLHFISHEGGGLSAPEPYHAGSCFLILLAKALEIQIDIPGTTSTSGNNALTLMDADQKTQIGSPDPSGKYWETPVAVSWKHQGKEYLAFHQLTRQMVADITDPAKPVAVASVDLQTFANSSKAAELDASWFEIDSRGISRIDLSDPAHPKPVALWKHPTLLDASAIASGLIYRTPSAGVEPSHTMTAFEIANPSAEPKPVSTESPSSAYAMCATNSRLYVGALKKLVAFDRTNPLSLKLVAEHAMSIYTGTVLLADDAYVAVLSYSDPKMYGVTVVDFSEAKPKVSSKLLGKREVCAFDRQGDRLYTISADAKEKLYFSEISLGSKASLISERSFQLPSDLEEPEKITWMGVRGKELFVLTRTSARWLRYGI